MVLKRRPNLQKSLACYSRLYTSVTIPSTLLPNPLPQMLNFYYISNTSNDR